MKKLFLVLLILSFAAVSFAGPFLVCDIPPADQDVTSYTLYKDGVLVDVSDAQSDGSFRYDLNEVVPGAYEWTLKAENVWGASDFSDPYISPSSAGKPRGFQLTE